MNLRALGIGSTDRAARGVIVDESGTIVERAVCGGRDAGAALRAVSAEAKRRDGIDVTGIAVHNGAFWEPEALPAGNGTPSVFNHFRCEMSPLGDDGIAIDAARLALLGRL